MTANITNLHLNDSGELLLSCHSLEQHVLIERLGILFNVEICDIQDKNIHLSKR